MGEVAIECRSLTRSFGAIRAVDGVDLSFDAGAITALIGPNGAGKTTLFHLITGALKPESGEILYRGRRIDGARLWETARLGIGRLLQDVRIFGRLTVLENVLVAFREQLGESPLAAVFARRRIDRDEAEHEREARRWLDLVALGNHASVLAGALSYGQQKLLAIARLLAAGADALLLDEPSAGVHPALMERLLVVIRRLASEGKAVAVIEHNMDVVLDVADWVYFMEEGQIAAFGLTSEVLGDPSVRASYLGL